MRFHKSSDTIDLQLVALSKQNVHSTSLKHFRKFRIHDFSHLFPYIEQWYLRDKWLFLHPTKITMDCYLEQFKIVKTFSTTKNTFFARFVNYVLNSRGTLSGVNANIWTIEGTGWSSMHISTSCVVVCFRHSIYPRW